MQFTRDELKAEVEKTEKEEYLKVYPHKTKAVKDTDKTPFQLIFANKLRYYDINSHYVKDILYKSRKNISKNCFNSEVLFSSVYPNEEKINKCIRDNSKDFTMLETLKETHFGNIYEKFQSKLNNCPSGNLDCKVEAEQEYVWNAAKLPYFFAETVHNTGNDSKL